MLARLTELYGGLPAGAARPDRAVTAEPVSRQEQRVELTGPGDTTYLRVAYHAPAASNPDFFAFSVLDSLLSGATSLNMFGGGGVSNKTSRLYRALVERELAVSVHGGMSATIDPFLYDGNMIVREDRSPEQVLAAYDDEVRRLQDQLAPEAEIKRAIKQARALFAYGSENITNQAFWLGYAEMFDSYSWFTGYLDSLDRVTPTDVQRIAQQYLVPSNRVVGVYIPNGEELQEGDDDETN
jgi:zinc protease